MKKKILKFISLTMILTLFFSIGTLLKVEAKNRFNKKPTAKDGFVAGLGLLSVIAILTPIPGDEIIVGGALLGL